MSLAGKTAVVTGGSRGIGRAVVERFAAEGARVVYSYRHKPGDELDGVTAVRADAADLGSLDALFAGLDSLDILVNNAATTAAAPIGGVTPAQFREVMTVNVEYPLMAIGRAADLMRDGGRIINVSTVNTALPAARHVLYCASKGALEQVTAVAAKELGPRGITVNTVSPGATATDLLRSVNTPEALRGAVAVTALGRLGRTADLAGVVAFLAGPDGGWITGQNIRATGGYVI